MIISMENFKRGRGHPGMSPSETREQVKARLAHPLFKRWQILARRAGVLANEWGDFWVFVSDVSPKPDNAKKLRRLNENAPLGPANWEWAITPTQEDKRAYFKAYYDANRDVEKDKRFQRKYGIGLKEYEKLYQQQDGKCAICRKPEKVRHRVAKGAIRMLSIDHHHGSGFTRALLCGDCNRGLGMFKDDSALLRLAADYLDSHHRKRLRMVK